jgi:hypothetical protein
MPDDIEPIDGINVTIVTWVVCLTLAALVLWVGTC